MIFIKVLQIISGNDNGGGGNHVLNLTIYSKDKFHCIIGTIGGGPLYEKAKESGVDIVQFSSKVAYDGTLLSYVKENNIDIINFHGAKAFFMHLFLKSKLQIPSAATIHSDYKKDFINNRIKQIFFTPLSIVGLKSFKYYICVSNYIKKLVEQDNFKGNKYVVNNGLDYNSIDIAKDKNEVRKLYNIEDKDFVYVNVARMHPIKNHLGLIEAFKKLKGEKKDTKLILVGDGELEESIKEKIHNLGLDKDIILTGFIDNPLDIVNAADIGILTSFSEGGSPPLVLLESAALKKSFICSMVGDVEETIDNKSGFLVNADSVDSIYERMLEAYDKKEKLDDMGENLYKFVKERYSMESFCSKYHEVYKEILVEK